MSETCEVLCHTPQQASLWKIQVPGREDPGHGAPSQRGGATVKAQVTTVKGAFDKSSEGDDSGL